jgi:hypothetical protein
MFIRRKRPTVNACKRDISTTEYEIVEARFDSERVRMLRMADEYKFGGDHRNDCVCPVCKKRSGEHYDYCVCPICKISGGKHNSQCTCPMCQKVGGEHYSHCTCAVCQKRG